MDFRFLYDKKRRLFSIGYRLADIDTVPRLDPSFYDLLASEARLASFIAIAKGDVPELHWFHLGRLITSVRGAPVLLSWSATQFEYLMPMLLMRNYPDTLLDVSNRMAVQRQIDYGATRGTPWGISESAYTSVDRLGNYQYKAFGVPGLGLKRGLGDELVVAPYATALAVAVDPVRAARNLRKLAEIGMFGDFGFYESIDYTDRGTEDTHKPGHGTIVRAFFAHHAGMSLVAIANAVLDDRMVDRFHADSRVQATELLLQERIPRQQPITEPRPLDEMTVTAPSAGAPLRRYRTPHTVFPHAQFLSNGKYVAAVTNAGGGGSSCDRMAVTRSRQDGTCDPGSHFIYLRDIRSGSVWSPTFHPTRREPESYLATFQPDKAILRVAQRAAVGAARSGGGARARRRSPLPAADQPQRPGPRDRHHQLRRDRADAAARRLRPSGVRQAVHRNRIPAGAIGAALPPPAARFARDRPVGDARDEPRGPAAGPARVGNRSRAVHRPGTHARESGLDGRPAAVGHHRVRARSDPEPAPARAAAGRANRCASVLPPASRPIAKPPRRWPRPIAMPARRRAPSRWRSRTRKASAATWTSRTTRRVLFERLASRVIGGDGSLRAPEDMLAANELGQTSLWPHGISGDLPIFVVRVVDDELGIVRQALEAQEYWRLKGLKADLVILNEHPMSYMDEVQSRLTSLLDDGPWRMWKHQPGGVFLLRTDTMGQSERHLFLAVARAVLETSRGDLRAHLARPPLAPIATVPLAPPLAEPSELDPPAWPSMAVSAPNMTLRNGLGGFADDGATYAIVLEGDQETPAPWSNVICESALRHRA